jgi:hypothetical protein
VAASEDAVRVDALESLQKLLMTYWRTSQSTVDVSVVYFAAHRDTRDHGRTLWQVARVLQYVSPPFSHHAILKASSLDHATALEQLEVPMIVLCFRHIVRHSNPVHKLRKM